MFDDGNDPWENFPDDWEEHNLIGNTCTNRRTSKL